MCYTSTMLFFYWSIRLLPKLWKETNQCYDANWHKWASTWNINFGIMSSGVHGNGSPYGNGILMDYHENGNRIWVKMGMETQQHEND